MNRLFLLAVGLSLTLVLGCGGDGSDKDAKTKDKTTKKEPHDHSKGRHGGHPVELGEEEAHAEWLHDDPTGTLTVYILDDHMHEDVAIAADSITIETKMDGKVESISIPAVREGSAEKTAKFETVNKALIERLKMVGPAVEAKIMVDFNGKKLVGQFEKHEH